MVSCLMGRTRKAIAIAILGAAFSSATAAAPGTGLPGTVQLAKSPPMLASATATPSIAANETLRKASLPGASLRARLLSVDLSVLERAKTSILADALPQIIRVPFFDDAVLDIEILRTEPTSSGGTAYVGRLIGDPHSIAVLVNNNGTVSFNVAGLGQRHELHGSAEAGFVAKQKTMVDRPDHPPGSTGIVERVLQEVRDIAPQKNVIGAASALASLKTPPLAVQTLADSGATIDIMVVYTPAARLSQTPGTTAQMNANIDAQIVTTNTIYANSNATQRLRLVYKGEVNYTEVNMDVDLPRLENTSDGFLDDVPILRNLYAADLVSLWGVYSDYCGLGSLMSTESASFESVGYNVVASPNCTGAGGYTFAHELGHNMGLRHDNYVDTGTNSLTPEGSAVQTPGITYAHGYIDLTNRFRTVMSYNNQCTATPPNTSCARIPNFSNPSVLFSGATTGNAANAHEQRALNDTRETVANFRQSLASFTGPGIVSFLPASYSVAEGAGNVTLMVARNVGSTGAVSVNYATANGTATAGSDYTATSGTLNWADSDTSAKPIVVPILQDALLEGKETFVVNLTGATGGASVGAAGGTTTSATVTIIDDEPDTFPAGGVFPSTYTQATPASPWSVDLGDGYLSGTSLKSSAVIGPDQVQYVNSDMDFSGTFAAGNATFAYRVSSYATSYGILEFYVDGALRFSSAGGETGWLTRTEAITAGAHTLRWRFKNRLNFPCANAIPAAPGGANCADRAWVDQVVLPLSGNTLNVSKTGTGTGTVSGTGINCGADCTETAVAGTMITLTATPDATSLFAGWSGGGCAGTGTCNVTLSSSQFVVATFNLLPEVFPVTCAQPAGWTTPVAADGGWIVASDRKRTGTCSLKTSIIGNSAVAQTQTSGNYQAGNVSFYYNVSSEPGWDCLRFFVDTISRSEMGSCSNSGGFGATGEVATWTLVTIPVAAGNHTFTWSYEKDFTGTGGSDAAWIDDVTLPSTTPTVCVAGTFSASGLTPCTNASPGNFVATTGAMAQTACALGFYQPATAATACIAASVGNFVSTTGSASQTVCPLGRFQGATGQSSCTLASAGNFVGMTGATTQTACGTGSYQPATGASACILASAGNFVAGTGAIVQVQCSAGTFQAATGASACNPATAGNFVANPGSSIQTACLAGTFQANASATSCNPASPGSFVATTGATSQTACLLGTYQPNPGSNACIAASAGNFVAGTGAIGQIQCIAGTFQGSTGASSCNPAAAGSFVAAPGAAVQTSCAMGQYQPMPGQTSCVSASAGNFVSTTGATGQTACSMGTFQPNPGSSACIAASAGNFVASNGAITQTQCTAGTFQGSAGASSCNPAAAGSFVANPGASSQTACLAGTFQPATGATACNPAAAGNFVAMSGATAQTQCSLGTYQPSTASTSCLQASPGNFVSILGAIAQTACSAGSYQPLGAATSCLLAQPGFFVSTIGAIQQTACAAGTTSNMSGATSCFSIVPSAPGIGAAIAGNAQAQIPFTVPMQDGGSPILDYTVTCIGPNTVMATGTVSPLVVSPLTNTQLYSCSITARNTNGSGTASATANVTPQSGALLALSSVVSRKFHTTVGPLDIPIDRNPMITGPVTVEPRVGVSGHTIVFQFNNTVTGTGMVVTTAGNATATFVSNSNEVLVTLTNVPDNSRATITLTNVPSANGSAGGSVSIGFLVGDVSNSRSVNASDIAAIKAHQNQIPNTATARFDLNASGTVNATDVSAAKARAGIVLP